MRIAKSWCPHQKKMSKEKMGKEMGREKVGKEKKAYKEKKKGKNLKKIRCTKQGCCGLPKLAPGEKGCSHWLPCLAMGWTAPSCGLEVGTQFPIGLDSPITTTWAGQPHHGLDSPIMG